MGTDQELDSHRELRERHERAAMTPSARGTKSTSDVLFGGPTSQKLVVDELHEIKRDELALVGVTPEARAVLRQDHERLLADTGLEAHGLGRTIIKAHLEEVRATQRGRRTEAEEAELAGQREAARQAVFSTYGAVEGEKLLARAQKFVAAHPSLSKLVNTGTLGNRRDLVVGLVEHVRRVNYR